MGSQAPTATSTTTIATVTNIHETSDYSIFKLLEHNRPVVQTHVAHLAQSMEDRPHLRPARPVLLNEKNEVIDGQHRLAASKVNQQSVFFMVVPGLTIEDARLLNALQRTWSLLDYAYSYASSRVPAYVQFIKTYESRELPPSVIMEYMSGSQGSRRQYEFRIGKMQPIDQKILDQKLDQLEEVLAEFPRTATPYIVSMAFYAVQKNEAYSHDRMMKKLEGNRPEVQPDRVAYIRELERIYNTDIQFGGPNYLRFF